MRFEGRSIEDFGKAARRTARCIRRQLRSVKEPALQDFPVWRRDAGTLPLRNDEEGDVIAWQAGEIREQAMKLWRPCDDDPRLFLHFARKGGFRGLSPLDTASREMPSWPVAVAHEQDALIIVDDDALRAKGGAAR
jgi:hypothetical protein